MMVRMAVVGNELTDVGLMLQLFVPVAVQLRLTMLLKPSCEAIAIEPVVPMLPAFTVGKAPGSVRMKSGFSTTEAVNDAVAGPKPPLLTACRVTV